MDIPSGMNRAAWDCVACGKDVAKGELHVRLRDDGPCIAVTLAYEVAPDGTMCRGADGLPIWRPVRSRWA